jgi:hypothetical protein
MFTRSLPRFRLHILRVIAGSCVLVFSTAFAITDADGDGYDEVWQSLHGVTVAEMPLDSDFDGDGSSNLTESEAGTDPRDPDDYLRVTGTTLSSKTRSLMVDSKSGKRYQLRSSPLPGGPTWTDAGTPETGTGSIPSLIPVS